MKLYLYADEEIKQVVSEAISELGHQVVTSEDTADARVRITLDGNAAALTLKETEASGVAPQFTITCAGRAAMLRGISHILEGTKEITEYPAFGTVSAMPDCSRNAVMRCDAVKQLIRSIAMMGLNGLMLYTEDTYEVPGEPRFGHLRGRYTQEELRDLDRYATRFGVELIPCVQMLAHFDAIMKWPEYQSIKDWDNILNLSKERSYELLERCIKSLSESFSTRRINIGMDEAYLLGRGHYLETMGYRTGTEIMRDHLGRVMEILRKYGMKPMMWSDMFFRQCNPSHSYRDPRTVITEEVKKMVPEDLTLVYWDYYQLHEEDYARQFGWHEEFGKPFAFAGGSSTWYGLVPLNRFSLFTARMALSEALKRTERTTGKRSIHDVICTMWGDNGAQSSEFSCLATLQLYAEAQWNGDMSDEHVGKRFRACVGASFEAFLQMEDLENLPGRTTFGEKPLYPTRYLFYQDVVQGKYDAHVPEGCEARFQECEKEMRDIAGDPAKCGRYGYLFETLAAFARVLSKKAELGLKVRKAYLEKDIAAMKHYIGETLPAVIWETEELGSYMQLQWMKENKAFGFEVQQIRLGGLLMRLRYALNLLTEWVENAKQGRFTVLEELEAERLPVRAWKESDLDGVLISENKWNLFVSASII